MLNNSQYAKVITDQASLTVTYVGFAQNNFTATSDPLWNILRITQASSAAPVGVTLYEWASEPGVFTAVWDDRTSLTYNS